MPCKNIKVIFSVACFWLGTGCAQTNQSDFDAQMQKILVTHYNSYKDLEYFSGASLSVYVPQQGIKNYYVGRISRDPKSKAVSSETLFQIGSITKSFTAAIILQLEKEGKLKLTDPLNKWLPEYSKWSAVSISQLLNMTSGLPNYSDTPLLNTQIYYNLSRIWTDKELLATVYPQPAFSPPLKSGFFYTNTGYILSALIAQQAGKDTFANQLTGRTIRLANLNNTFYVLKTPEAKTQTRLAHGYNYNQYDNPAMVGKDIYEGNLSWAAAAGGIISNTQDMVKWVKALFIDNKILDETQKNKLMSLISQSSGKAIAATSVGDPRGFGLGVAQAAVSQGDLGRFWYYEGKTLGFRAVYWYKVCNGVIISAAFNSATNDENDHVGILFEKAYQLVLTQYPQLHCQD